MKSYRPRIVLLVLIISGCYISKKEKRNIHRIIKCISKRTRAYERMSPKFFLPSLIIIIRVGCKRWVKIFLAYYGRETQLCRVTYLFRGHENRKAFGKLLVRQFAWCFSHFLHDLYSCHFRHLKLSSFRPLGLLSL